MKQYSDLQENELTPLACPVHDEPSSARCRNEQCEVNSRREEKKEYDCACPADARIAQIRVCNLDLLFFTRAQGQ
jgi:hypothetical protein